MNPESSPASLLNFFFTLGNLKTTKRTGWVESNIKGPESISDHMHRMSLMALMINDPSLNISRCVQIAIVHDVAESIVGDIAPSQNVSKEDKRRLEEGAMISFLKQLGESPQIHHIYELWLEYENCSTPEAKLVKDLDKFEMITQAFEYEKSNNTKLESFFLSTRGKFHHPQVVSWVSELYEQREIFWLKKTDY